MNKTRKITIIGVLSTLAVVLYFLEFPLFIYFPSYLKLDLSDIPAILGGIAAGPAAGVAIELVKNIFHSIFRSNSPFNSGDIANFFAGVGLLVPIVIMLRRNGRNSVLPYIMGALSMTVVANIMNYFVTLPLYGMPKEARLPTIISFLIPFNLLKAVVVSIITAILYNSLKHYVFRKQPY